MKHGHGQKRSRKREQALAALLSEATVRAAAAKAGLSHSTLKRWLQEPGFLTAYRRARRELLETSIGRLQAATGTAVDTLVAVAKDGARDGDRVRAAVALLDHAFRGLAEADLLHDDREPGERAPVGTSDVVEVLAGRLRQVDRSELPSGEKARLTAGLADALLRALAADVLEKRLEALEAVLIGRKDQP